MEVDVMAADEMTNRVGCDRDGFTKSERKEILFILEMKNLEAQSEEIRDFESKTGKEFPNWLIDRQPPRETAFSAEEE
jgi:hypothetical protein